jgi:hypothetical protein
VSKPVLSRQRILVDDAETERPGVSHERLPPTRVNKIHNPILVPERGRDYPDLALNVHPMKEAETAN